MNCKEEESRTALLLGEEALGRLHGAKVAVFGVGGVGGYVCEALARAGVGALTLIDKDTVSLSNLNRQIIALHSTVGMEKVEVMKNRIRDINPDCQVTAVEQFYLPENADSFSLESFDYVVDAIDTVSAKVELAVRCHKLGIPNISAMGAGNKLDPTAFTVKDLSKTSGCPLARVMRHKLRQHGITHLKVVCSEETAVKPLPDGEVNGNRPVPGSAPFVPGVAGLIIAGEVIKDLIAKQ